MNSIILLCIVLRSVHKNRGHTINVHVCKCMYVEMCNVFQIYKNTKKLKRGKILRNW